MRTVLGLLLVMLGLALAVVWMPERDSEQQLAAVTEIATQGIARVAPPETVDLGKPRSFSPQSPLLSPQPQPPAAPARPTQTASAAAPTPVTTVRPAAVVKPAEPARQSEVLISSALKSPAQPAAPAAGQRLTSSRPSDEIGRVDLVRQLQRELRRVGCYGGEITGDWGPNTQRAMTAFTDRVNASLPVNEPDYILLTLVQGHAGQACGRGCPGGQSMSDRGQCVPNAVLAQGSRKAQEQERKGQREPVAARAADPSWTKAPTGRPSDPAWSATAQQTEPTAAAAAAAAAAATIAATATVAPPPGRMSVGAPVPAPTELLAPGGAARNGNGSYEFGLTNGNGNGNGARPAQQQPRPVVVYRQPPQYAYSPPRTPSGQGRTWMQNFFNR